MLKDSTGENCSLALWFCRPLRGTSSHTRSQEMCDVFTLHTTQTLESLTVFLYVFTKAHHAPLWKYNLFTRSQSGKTQGFLFGVDTLDITNNRLIVKEKCEECSEENRDCQSLWATCRYSIEHECTSLWSLPSLLWLMFRQKDAEHYNGCWQSSCLTGFCFDSAQCFQRTAIPLFFSFCGEVDRFCSVLHLVSSSPQVSFDSCGRECSDYSSSTRPWPRANVLLSTVPVKLGETGRSGRAAALNIYILRGSRGVQAKTRLIKHFHIEKHMIVYLEKHYCPFYGPE